jgi:hypothetical protein
VADRSLTTLVSLVLLASCAAEPRPGAPEATPSAQASDSVAPSPPTQASDSPAVQPGPALLTPDGWGPLRIGMSRAEVVAAAGEDADPDAVGGPDPATCDEFRPRDAPAGVLVMIERGTLTRISVSRTAEISTPEGLGVGDSGAAVEAAYGDRARVEPHQYWEAPGRYVTVWRESADGRRGIRYEIDTGDRVVHVRGGGVSIEYVEGCV